MVRGSPFITIFHIHCRVDRTQDQDLAYTIPWFSINLSPKSGQFSSDNADVGPSPNWNKTYCLKKHFQWNRPSAWKSMQRKNADSRRAIFLVISEASINPAGACHTIMIHQLPAQSGLSGGPVVTDNIYWAQLNRIHPDFVPEPYGMVRFHNIGKFLKIFFRDGRTPSGYKRFGPFHRLIVTIY